MPPNTVYVGRPTIWGNPFHVFDGDRAEAVAIFSHMMDYGGHSFYRRRSVIFVTKTRVRHNLAGKNLACWCPLDQPCHADVLLRIANSSG